MVRSKRTDTSRKTDSQTRRHVPRMYTQAIENSQEAVNLIPGGNPNRAGRLNNLSSHLSTRYEREGKLEDLTQAVEYRVLRRSLRLFRSAARLGLPPGVRLTAS